VIKHWRLTMAMK